MGSGIDDEAILTAQTDRRQLQEIVAGLGEGILLIDLSGEIVWANQQALFLHDA